MLFLIFPDIVLHQSKTIAVLLLFFQYNFHRIHINSHHTVQIQWNVLLIYLLSSNNSLRSFYVFDNFSRTLLRFLAIFLSNSFLSVGLYFLTLISCCCLLMSSSLSLYSLSFAIHNTSFLVYVYALFPLFRYIIPLNRISNNSQKKDWLLHQSFYF